MIASFESSSCSFLSKRKQLKKKTHRRTIPQYVECTKEKSWPRQHARPPLTGGCRFLIHRIPSQPEALGPPWQAAASAHPAPESRDQRSPAAPPHTGADGPRGRPGPPVEASAGHLFRAASCGAAKGKRGERARNKGGGERRVAKPR